MISRSLLLDHSMRFSNALYYTQLNGIKIDIDLCTKFGVELSQEIEKTKKEMKECAQHEIEVMEYEAWANELSKYKKKDTKLSKPKPEFNFSSPSQLGELLYERLKLPGKKTRPSPKTGVSNWRTDKAYLEEISTYHALPKKISYLNRLSIYYNTFIEGMLSRADGDRIYPSFNINGTATYRISHQNPNMGNIPARDPQWSKIRNIFLPDDGKVFFKSDYSQLEIVIAAHYSQDKNLLRVVNDGVSMHDITAEGVGIPRVQAKTLNFALQYGAGVSKVMLILDCSKKEAQLAFNKYWETYRGYKELVDWCHKQVDEGNDIISICGDIYRFEKKKRVGWDKDYRRATSCLIQGTGGRLMNTAFTNAHEELLKKEIGHGAWTVHDEGIGQAKEQYAKEGLDILEKYMVNIGKEVGLSVPLKVEGETGLKCWKK